MKFWQITFHPEPRMGGDPSLTIVRLIARTDASEPPAFELTLRAAIELQILGDALETGVTSTCEPTDEEPATEPGYRSDGLAVWRV